MIIENHFHFTWLLFVEKYFIDILFIVFQELNTLLSMVIVFVRDSISVLKHHDLKQLGKNRIYLSLQL